MPLSSGECNPEVIKPLSHHQSRILLVCDRLFLDWRNKTGGMERAFEVFSNGPWPSLTQIWDEGHSCRGIGLDQSLLRDAASR